MKLKQLLPFLSTVAVLGVGPKIPCILTFDSDPTPGVTGYYFYFRTTNGVYNDVARLFISTNHTPNDLRILGLPKGRYYCTMTSVMGTNSESDPLPDVLWDYVNGQGPSKLVIQPNN